MRTRLGLLIVAVLALGGAGACSDDGAVPDLTAEEQVYADAIVAAATAADDDRDVLFSLGDPRCLAPHYVQVIGVDRLEREWGGPDDLDPDSADLELSDEEAAANYDASGACGTDLREAAIDGILEQAGDDPSLRSCMEAALTDDGVRALVIHGVQHGQEEIARSMVRGTFDDPAVEEAVVGMLRCYAGAFGPEADGGGDGG